MRIFIMNDPKKLFSICCIILIFLVLYSCGASHYLRDDLVYLDNGFSYDHLKGSGIIIGGVSSKIITLQAEDRIKYSSLLLNKLLESLKDVHNIRLVSTIQFIDEIGKNNYFGIMDYFDEKKHIEKDKLQFIRDSIPDINYILFSYIANENIVDNSIDQYVKDEKGEDEIETEYQKTYYLTLEFFIYDLTSQKIVLENVVYNRAEQTETRTTGTGCFESCMQNIFDAIVYGEPAEIDREEVLAKIYEKFAKDLAKI